MGLMLLAASASFAFAAPGTITRSKAIAAATAISLRHSDLPSLREESNPLTPQDQRLGLQLTACVGGVPETQAFANTQSPEFASAGQPAVNIASGNEILPSASLVAKDLAASERPHALSCMLSSYGAQLRASLPKSDTVTGSVARLPYVVSGSTATFAVRLTFAVRVTDGKATVTVPFYADVVGLAYGPAEFSLTVTSTSVTPSKPLELRLADLLVARAKSAIG
ncbi:MAG: hypothetical protein ABSF58_13240 [Solirubrobacteraceae bacterium]